MSHDFINYHVLPYIVKRGRRLKMAHEEAPKKRMESLEKVKGKTQKKCRKSTERSPEEDCGFLCRFSSFGPLCVL